MKKIAVILLVLLSFSCEHKHKEGVNKENLSKQIKVEEKALKDISPYKLDVNKANFVISLYKNYADAFLNDSLTPEYLFKAAELSIGVKEYDQAIGYFQRIVKNYKDFDKSPQSLFLIGFVYDEYKSEKGKAEEFYKRVITEYPSDQWAQDAQASIDQLHMTDEEIIKMLQEKNPT